VPRTKEVGKRVCSIIVILIYIIENKAFKIRIIIKITIKIRKDRYRIRVLINSDIEANYIKRKLALDINILLILRIILLILLEERRIHLYKDYILRIITKNIIRN
jgi:hypothetical protein